MPLRVNKRRAPRDQSLSSDSIVEVKAIKRTGKSLKRFDIDEWAIDVLNDENITAEQKERIFKVVGTVPHIRFLAKKAPETIIEIFELIFDDSTGKLKLTEDTRIRANKRLEWLLSTEKDNTSEETRDKLYRFQDMTDQKVRRAVTKRSDSGLDAEREEALRTLIEATLLCTDESRSSQIRRTVQFFAKKLKNESIDRRRTGIKILFGSLNETLHELITSDECMQSVLGMLNDCLEVQDLDIGESNVSWHNVQQHKVLKYFYHLSLEAITLAVRQKMNKKLFHFGVELQWRMCKYRLGTADAASQFRIDLGDITNRGEVLLEDIERKRDLIGSVLKSSEMEHKTEDDVENVISADDSEEEKEQKLLDRIYFKEEFEGDFVTLYLNAYKERVERDNEEFMKTSKNQVCI